MKRGFWTGLLVLLIIYTITYLFFYEAPYLEKIPRKIRHLLKFSILITVYLIGTYHLRLEKHKWINACWHIIHLSGILLIIIIGLYDWLIAPTSSFIRNFASSVNEFLISPLLYFIMWGVARFENISILKNL